MSSFTCIIIDDEPIARNILLEYIQRDDRLVVVASYANAVDALREINMKKPRLMFLDIKMPNISGFEMLRSLSQHPYVIFTTAFREYAIEGFNLNAVDYLLKPFSFERFLQAVNKAYHLFSTESAEIPLAAPMPQNNNDGGKDIFVKSDGKLVRIHVRDIYYIEALKEYIRIHTPGGNWVVYQTMQHIEEKLPKELFFRIHRSFIVGLSHIKSIEGNCVMVNEMQLPISRYCKDGFMERITGNKLL
ncbi:MAG: response regulator transcription factor [Chitinophagaceae bacterium]|nr:response regulator transcription factor [Chitinophagaceae bacterium]